MRSVISIAVSLVAFAPLLAGAPVSGEEVYKQRCAQCHDSGNPRVPPRSELNKFSVARILRAMDFGVMNNIATRLRQEEREAVAAYLGIPGDTPQPSATAYCSDRTVKLTGRAKTDWNGWSPAVTWGRYRWNLGRYRWNCQFRNRFWAGLHIRWRSGSGSSSQTDHVSALGFARRRESAGRG